MTCSSASLFNLMISFKILCFVLLVAFRVETLLLDWKCKLSSRAMSNKLVIIFARLLLELSLMAFFVGGMTWMSLVSILVLFTASMSFASSINWFLMLRMRSSRSFLCNFEDPFQRWITQYINPIVTMYVTIYIF